MNTEVKLNASEYVAGLVKRARVAQEAVENYTQEQVDKLVDAKEYMPKC